ncbi:hypothetical protein VNI00_018798 [Paramarasmius palmivorus]|uniref:Uncharacterized protein n=1 Tax=Paramarasmius palmivorus TaxID=297713 RepID=A0AAW0AWC5_9AGAR
MASSSTPNDPPPSYTDAIGAPGDTANDMVCKISKTQRKWIEDQYLAEYYWKWEIAKEEGIKKHWVESTVLDPFIAHWNLQNKPRATLFERVYRVFLNTSGRIRSGGHAEPPCPDRFTVPAQAPAVTGPESEPDTSPPSVTGGTAPTPTEDETIPASPARATSGQNEWRIANSIAIAAQGRRNAPGAQRAGALEGWRKAYNDGWNALSEIQHEFWHAKARELNGERHTKPPCEHVLQVTVVGQKSKVVFQVPEEYQEEYEHSFLEPLRNFKQLIPIDTSSSISTSDNSGHTSGNNPDMPSPTPVVIDTPQIDAAETSMPDNSETIQAVGDALTIILASHTSAIVHQADNAIDMVNPQEISISASSMAGDSTIAPSTTPQVADVVPVPPNSTSASTAVDNDHAINADPAMPMTEPTTTNTPISAATKIGTAQTETTDVAPSSGPIPTATQTVAQTASNSTPTVMPTDIPATGINDRM